MKTPYNERSDLKKIQSQWHKLTGLHTRDEWSAAVIRAATATELAVNFAIRNEFKERSTFDEDFVDSLLLWANGLGGKMQKLLLPLSNGTDRRTTIRKTKGLSKRVNAKRNAIAHRGEFCGEKAAKAIIEDARTFIETLMQLYKPSFKLRDQVSK
jgi:hypothetical protein